MFRHSLPRFDLHLGHALHHAAEWIGLHPASTVAGLVASAAMVAGAAVYPGVSRSGAVWRDRLLRPRTLRAWPSLDAPVHTQHRG